MSGIEETVAKVHGPYSMDEIRAFAELMERGEVPTVLLTKAAFDAIVKDAEVIGD